MFYPLHLPPNGLPSIPNILPVSSIDLLCLPRFSVDFLFFLWVTFSFLLAVLSSLLFVILPDHCYVFVFYCYLSVLYQIYVLVVLFSWYHIYVPCSLPLLSYLMSFFFSFTHLPYLRSFHSFIHSRIYVLCFLCSLSLMYFLPAIPTALMAYLLPAFWGPYSLTSCFLSVRESLHASSSLSCSPWPLSRLSFVLALSQTFFYSFTYF